MITNDTPLVTCKLFTHYPMCGHYFVNASLGKTSIIRHSVITSITAFNDRSFNGVTLKAVASWKLTIGSILDSIIIHRKLFIHFSICEQISQCVIQWDDINYAWYSDLYTSLYIKNLNGGYFDGKQSVSVAKWCVACPSYDNLIAGSIPEGCGYFVFAGMNGATIVLHAAYTSTKAFKMAERIDRQ